MAGEEGSWRTAAFRQSVVSKIDEAIQRSGMPTAKNSVEMENHVFQKAKTKEEYLSFVARLILHVRELNAKKGQGMNGPAGGAGQTMQDPINALQTLARQGTGNTQMIGLGPQAAGMVPQPPNQIPASNLKESSLGLLRRNSKHIDKWISMAVFLPVTCASPFPTSSSCFVISKHCCVLQTLNQRPGQPLGALTSLQNKVPDLGLGPGAQFEKGSKMENQTVEDFDLNLLTPATPLSSATLQTSATQRALDSNESISDAPCGKRKRLMEGRTREMQSVVESKVNELQTWDTFDAFGQHVANKLCALTPQQNLFAQKLINDVLLEGGMESLNKNFKVVEVETGSKTED